MKQARPITLVLLAGACVFLLYKATHRSARAPQHREEQQATVAPCDQDLWKYVYKPERLRILNPCISITGIVEKVTREPDGDLHVRLRLDPPFTPLLNDKNISRQHGDLVVELICQGNIRQTDALDFCDQYNGLHLRPEVGERYRIWGSYVQDEDHGWNELHPVTSMEPLQ
jgi:hypothetical protein